MLSSLCIRVENLKILFSLKQAAFWRAYSALVVRGFRLRVRGNFREGKKCWFVIVVVDIENSLPTLVVLSYWNMSLRSIAPRLVTRCHGSNSGATIIFQNTRLNVVRRRAFSTPSKTANNATAEEVEAALEKANESMKAYYSYPPEKVIAAKKLKFQQRLSDRQFILQLGLSESESLSK